MVFAFDEYELDADRLGLWRAGKYVPAEALVLRLLACLVRHAGRLVTKPELIAEVWDGRAIADNAITVSMARLRNVLGQRRGERELIATTYGRGYRFMSSVVVLPAPNHAIAWRTAPSREPPFVGREAILGQLRRALTNARAGRGSCCLLMGDPGIGKTYAVEAFTRELGHENRVAWGFCREGGETPPLGPWLRLLREVAGESALRDLPAGARPMAEQTLQGLTRHRTFDALLRGLKLAAEQRPPVLVIDDLHRADAASLELLHHLLDEISHVRILVVAMLRLGDTRSLQRAGTHLGQVLGHRNSERITLAPLAEHEVAVYVRAFVDDAAGELGRAVFRKSEGNPFFMAELLRAVRDAAQHDPALLTISDAALGLTVQACRSAALAAAAVFANADVVRYTRHALAALELIDKPSIRLRTSLQYMIGIFGRGIFEAESAAATRDVVRLSLEQGDGEMLVRAATLMHLYPGLPPLPGVVGVLERALAILPESEPGPRAVALASLAIAPPNAFDAGRSRALLERAVSLARGAGSRVTLYAVLVCKLYAEGGPAHESETAALVEELEEMALRYPSVTPALPIDLALARAIGALQRGDSVAAASSIERAIFRCGQLHHPELRWHCRRAQAWAHLNAGDWDEGLPLLETLHRETKRVPTRSSALFSTFDRVLYASERGEPPQLDESARALLRYEASDPPNIWALKLRALASGAGSEEALSMLHAVRARDLARLPQDRDYLGTLGHVARAVLGLGAREYLGPLFELLSQQRGRVAIGMSFVCEGPIDQLLGMVAHALGLHVQAKLLLESGLRSARAHGLELRALETQLLLSRLGEPAVSPPVRTL